MSPRHEDFPSALEALFLVIALFGVEYVIGAALWDSRSVLGIDPRNGDGIVTLLGNGVIFSAVLYYKRLSYASLFHPSAQSLAATVGVLTVPILLVVPGLGLAVWTVQAILVSLFPLSSWHQAMFDRMMSNGLASVITACVLAPILEEMLFRGIVLRSFLRRYGRWHAIVGSAALFGLAHLNIYQFAVGLALGVVSGWLYERARSLWPCILLHGSYNALATWIYYDVQRTESADLWRPPLEYWISAFALAFVGAALLRRLLAPAGTSG